MSTETEYRIGNIVNECTMKIVGIMFRYGEDEYDIYVQKIGTLFIYKRPSSEIRPIPLSPKILEKCGFKQDEDEDSFDGLYVLQPDFENIQYHIREFPICTGTWIVFKGFLNFNHELTTVKYLHELQNLYYVHQKEELKIQL